MLASRVQVCLGMNVLQINIERERREEKPRKRFKSYDRECGLPKHLTNFLILFLVLYYFWFILKNYDARV